MLQLDYYFLLYLKELNKVISCKWLGVFSGGYLEVFQYHSNVHVDHNQERYDYVCNKENNPCKKQKSSFQ